jgi:hypothetical protein
MGVLLQTGVHVALGMFSHGARSYGRTPLVTYTVPMSSGCLQSRCANIVQATDWPIHLLCRYVGGMQSTRSAGYVEVDIALL